MKFWYLWRPFFWRNEVILWGQKHTAIFQTHHWEKSSFFNMPLRVFVRLYENRVKSVNFGESNNPSIRCDFGNVSKSPLNCCSRSWKVTLVAFVYFFFFFFSTFSALLWIDSSLLKIRGYFVFLSQKIGSGILTQSFSSYFATMLGNRRLVIWFKKIERTMDVSSQSGKRNCFSFINKWRTHNKITFSSKNPDLSPDSPPLIFISLKDTPPVSWGKSLWVLYLDEKYCGSSLGI